MDSDSRDHLCKLFVQATELLEATHELAVYGQARHRKIATLAAKALSLRQAGADLIAISDTMLAAIHRPHGTSTVSLRRKHPPIRKHGPASQK